MTRTDSRQISLNIKPHIYCFRQLLILTRKYAFLYASFMHTICCRNKIRRIKRMMFITVSEHSEHEMVEKFRLKFNGVKGMAMKGHAS